jgi:hypothetical protein
VARAADLATRFRGRHLPVGRAGHDYGYNITFAGAAMADPDSSAHEHCLRISFPKRLVP